MDRIASDISDDGMRPVSSMTADEIRLEKISIWKNVGIISLSFMCLFTAYNSVANLQVILNKLYVTFTMYKLSKS